MSVEDFIFVDDFAVKVNGSDVTMTTPEAKWRDDTCEQSMNHFQKFSFPSAMHVDDIKLLRTATAVY